MMTGKGVEVRVDPAVDDNHCASQYVALLRSGQNIRQYDDIKPHIFVKYLGLAPLNDSTDEEML